MSDDLPSKKRDWRRAATQCDIGPTQSLATGIAFVSGSKFKLEHFLRLRVLYEVIRLPQTLATSPGFPTERLKEMDNILNEDADVSFLREFLQKGGEIGSEWNVDKVKRSGKFAVAMEHLHLIAKRGRREMDASEDASDSKVIISPLKSRSTIQSTTQSRAHFHKFLDPTTPTRIGAGGYHESPLSDADPDVSGLSLAPPGPDGAEIFANLRRIKEKEKRSDFQPGDEQTVNAALVALIIALSWLLGHTGRVHHDRASFSVSSAESSAETDLYTAAVDGLIWHLNGDDCNGFMETKRDFRGENQSVRRQIAAQMAAFIFEQDVKFAAEETEQKTATAKSTDKKTKKAAKGKGKTESGNKKDSENQER